MQPKNIKVGKVYAGGVEERRRRVLKITEGGAVFYESVKIDGKKGANGRCAMKSFAKWAEKTSHDKPYTPQKLAAIQKKRENRYREENSAPFSINQSMYGKPW